MQNEPQAVYTDKSYKIVCINAVKNSIIILADKISY